MATSLPLIVVTAGAITAAVIDLRTRRIPNAVTVSLAIAGLGLAASGLGRVGIGLSIAGCLVGLAIMLPGYLLRATGGGDVKLLAAIGTLLGPSATLRAFVAMAIAGGVIAIIVAYRRGRVTTTLASAAAMVASAGTSIAETVDTQPGNRFAYAPAIAIGAIVAALT